MQHLLCMHLYWVEFCVLCKLTDLNLQTPFINPVVVLTFLSSLFRLPRPFPYPWGFGTFPCHNIGLWTCNAQIKLPLKLLHRLPHLCHLPHPALPGARSAHLLSQSLISCAPHTRWLWSSPLVRSLKLLLKVGAYVCWCICSRYIWLHQLCISWILTLFFGGSSCVHMNEGGGIGFCFTEQHINSLPCRAQSCTHK